MDELVVEVVDMGAFPSSVAAAFWIEYKSSRMSVPRSIRLFIQSFLVSSLKYGPQIANISFITQNLFILSFFSAMVSTIC